MDAGAPDTQPASETHAPARMRNQPRPRLVIPTVTAVSGVLDDRPGPHRRASPTPVSSVMCSLKRLLFG